MLQPRVVGQTAQTSRNFGVFLCSLLFIIPSGFSQHSTDEPFIVEPTPAFRLNEEGDLTTVLLVNNENRVGTHGRYLSVKPAVGLLTSTARTFIQEGVTTEYATQVLGTTLDNGRLYAQLLKKSSRVLYDNKDALTETVSTVSGQTTVPSVTAGGGASGFGLQSHNDLVADKDWQLIDDHLLANPNTFVRNTDFIAPIDNPKGALLVFPTRGYLKEENEASESKESVVETFPNVQNDDHVLLRSDSKLFGNETISVSHSSSSTSSRGDNNQIKKISAEKVQPAGNLPTFTIKNMFAPSGFSWDSPTEHGDEHGASGNNGGNEKMNNVQSEYRSPKLLYNRVIDDHRMLSTVTYYGFADFTTIVGDTVIVFSPSTSQQNINIGQITSIKGEATLGGPELTHVTHVPITVTQDLIEPTFTIQTLSTNTDLFHLTPKDMRLNDDKNEQQDEIVDEKNIGNIQETTTLQYNEEQETTTEHNEEDYDGIDEEHTTIISNIDEEMKVHQNNIQSHEIQSSITEIVETSTSSTSNIPSPNIVESTTKMLSLPSDEDILKIFASLANAEAARKATEDGQQSEQIEQKKENEKKESGDEQEVKILGGATTIFFEDDPFQAFETTKTEEATVQPTQLPAPATDSSPSLEVQQSELEDETTERKLDTDLDTEISTISEDKQFINNEQHDDKTTTETNYQQEENDDEESATEIDKDNCLIKSSEVMYEQVPQTLTYLTTFFIPTDDEETSTSIESNVVITFDIVSSTKIHCESFDTILPTKIIQQNEAMQSDIQIVLERPNSDSSSTLDKDTTPTITTPDQNKNIDQQDTTTTPIVIITEKSHVTEAPNVGEDGGEDDEGADEEEEDEEDDQEDEDDGQQSDEEIELIYKTLYTTYTYLTTFFHDSTTSISSRKEIVTNVVTSTVNPTTLATDLDVTDILSSMSSSIQQISVASINENDNISPTTSVGIGRPTTKYVVPQSDLVQIDDILRSTSNEGTEVLNDKNVQQNGVKTYYTTYTYYTTIFDNAETEIMSHTEVYTNYVTESDGGDNTIIPTKKNDVEETISDEDNIVLDNIKPTAAYETIQRSVVVNEEQQSSSTIDDQHHSYSTVTRDQDTSIAVKIGSDNDRSTLTTESVVGNDGEIVTMITDVRSSSSDGDRHIIENINKQWNGLLEDQISSESNTEDILPSPTLLLQTSYTTFTFYTTMYSGSATNVVSRLETVTNVVTETLQPTQTVSLEDATLPITYFTTFTYWTTLVKDGAITTISREETISNVITPTAAITSTSESVSPSTAAGIDLITSESVATIKDSQISSDIQVTSSTDIEPTTFYTTYTYYTTSYAGDDTIINSRFETVTNVVTPVPGVTGRAIDINVGNTNSIVDSDNAKSKVEPVFQDAQQLNPSEGDRVAKDETTTSTTPIPDFISLNKGKIVDAEGISTIFYTTKAITSTIDGQLTEVIQSTSSINVDEVKKALTTTETDQSTKSYKTGLVRLIEGTMIANRTTTLYQSKVIGTVIDGRYAQIIESTSSFLIEKNLLPSSPVFGGNAGQITPTSTQSTDLVESLQTQFSATPSLNAVESSINDNKDDQESNTENPSGGDDDDNSEDGGVDENGKPKSRLTFSTRKRTFTPVIRPFASRNRPQFAPKRKNSGPNSATIVTRSDFTPTITATPAIKSDNSRGRFSSGRRGGGSAGVLSSSVGGGGGGGSSRRFSRPRSSISGSLSPTTQTPSSQFPGSARNRASSSKIQATSSYFGLSSRRGGGIAPRVGSSSGRTFSSAYLGNSRLRIKATASSSLNNAGNTNLYTTQDSDIETETVTQSLDETSNIDDDETEVTTENTRRSQNPLLRFRRPPLNVGKTPTRPGQVSTRRNPLTQRSKTTTTTTTTSTTPKPRPRAFQRPPIAPFQNRPRPQSSLFPPRGLFRPQNINQDLEEDGGNGKKPEDENDFGDDLESDNNEYEDEDGDDEEEEYNNGSSSGNGEDTQRKRRNSKKSRRRRQADFGSRNFRNRFRRPTTARNAVAEDRIDTAVEEEPAITARTRTTSRYSGSRANAKTTTSPRIRPTKPTTRTQFTLREKDAATKPSRASNFRRPTTSGLAPSRRTTTISRPKAPRLKSYINTVTESSHPSRSTSGRSRQATSRSRSTTRSRGRTTDYQANDQIVSSFDGTITVTHHIPTEITIPVVNGKVTEYKNVVTAKISTEILGPNQYNTIIGRNGNPILVLSREDTMINNNGATEVTQFILHETPTTSIIFTPTTIRGRRTSFSHVIPSTVYDVENIVSTIQPQIAANAPLANILLSQLLLGNIGLNQQNINPLLGLGGQTGVPGTPTTEYKTRTTTYVTEVTSAMSTVIPLTFRGKEILTTIIDSSVSVITATEFLTDTIVVTPTMAAAVQQVNSLLLPLLLQQQVQAQQNPLLPLQNTAVPALIGGVGDPNAQQLLFQENFQELDTNRIHKVNLDEFRDIRESEEFPEQDATYRDRQQLQQEQSGGQQVTAHRKRHRKGHKQTQSQAAQPQLETSVITLYVSGRRPGEFSTVLSTVISTPDSSLHKRQINDFVIPVEKSATVDFIEDLYAADESEIKEYLLPATNEILSSQEPTETQSLESIVGDVSLWYERTSDYKSYINTEQKNINNILSTTDNDIPLPNLLPINDEVEGSRNHENVYNNHIHPTVELRSLKNTHTQKNSPIHHTSPTTLQDIDTRTTTTTATTTTINASDEFYYNNGGGDGEEEGRFLGFSAAFGLDSSPIDNSNNDDDDDNNKKKEFIGDEARYNLATRIMSNGVEVIVANDKTRSTHKQSVLRILPSNLYKPMTLAPSTLKDQMILIVPSESKNNLTISISPNQFVTKTCLTTYTYRTTYLQDGKTTVESREKVISNIATEERNYLKISPTASSGVTLSRTPELAIGVFHTTYTYLNTIIDGELPLVLSSKHTVTNTITGPDDYISFLQPSEEATPVYETNTYYSKIAMTKTLKDSDIEKIISTSNILTQVIITESLPSKITPAVINKKSSSQIKQQQQKQSIISTTNVLRTQYVTYTYYNTIVDNDGTLHVHTNVSISPDILTETLFLYTKKSNNISILPSIKDSDRSTIIKPTEAILTDDLYSVLTTSNSLHVYDNNPSNLETEKGIHVYATKTYLTTFTYFTTLLKSNSNEMSSTIIDSHTRVIENVITESIPDFMLNTDLIEKFKKELIYSSKNYPIVTLATLLGGQSLEITATNILNPNTIIKTAVHNSDFLYSSTITTTATKLYGSLNNINSAALTATPITTTANIINQESTNSAQEADNSVQENDILDSDIAGSENEEVYSEDYKDIVNNTKLNSNQNQFQVSNLIGSLNLNGLTALGPVFNAMAGLLQHNFGGGNSVTNSHKNITVLNHIHNYPHKNVSYYNSGIGDHHSPIYIPVRGIHSDNIGDTIYFESQGSPASLHITPPEKWLTDGKMNRNNKLEFSVGKPTYETPLLNGGIPISPGEVITANSDVIIGKPAGTRPRVPFNTKLRDEERPNIIPLQYYYDDKKNVVDKHFDVFIRPPPPLAPPQQYAQKQSELQHQRPPIPLAPAQSQHQQLKYNIPSNQHPLLTHNYPLPHINSDLNINRGPPTTNEILEIKRIPEIYSTDLPPIEINYQQHIKKIINTNKPMLVNIKPSQIANVVIPHSNSASVLIIESTPELHKNGQYFDEPSPYPNTIIGDGVINQQKQQQQHKHNHYSSQNGYKKPIISNQQINLDSHILSHDIDINVPPIQFKKEIDFPHSAPVKGHINKNGQIHMSLVNIPLTNQNVQVDLTPQHVSLPTSYLEGHHEYDLDDGNIQNQQLYDSQKTSSNKIIDNIPIPLPVPVPPLSQHSQSSPHYKIQNNEKDSSIVELNYKYDDQRYSSISDMKPPLVQPHTKQQFPISKRRPIQHVLSMDKPFTFYKPNKINNQQEHKSRPIIPLNYDNYNNHNNNNNYVPPFTSIKNNHQKQQLSSYIASENVKHGKDIPSTTNIINTDQQNQQHNLEQYSVTDKNQVDDIGMQDFFNYFYYIQNMKDQNTNLSLTDAAGIDNSPSIIMDYVRYNHRDDDKENEEGEVVQESNSLPVIPGQYLSKRPNIIHLPPQEISPVTFSSIPVTTSTTIITTKPSTRRTRPTINTSIFTVPTLSSLLTTTRATTTAGSTTVKAILKNRNPFYPNYESLRPSEINNLNQYNNNNNKQLPAVIYSSAPTYGRPFTALPIPKSKPTSPPLIKPYRPNQPPIFMSIGEKFKKPVSPAKISMSIDSIDDENDTELSLTQTETPFNPKYIKTLIQNNTNTNLSAIIGDFNNVLSTKIKPIVDDITTTTIRNIFDTEKDSSEIFDFKESVNRHNLGVINNIDENFNKTNVIINIAENESTLNTHEEITTRNYNSHSNKNRNSSTIPPATTTIKITTLPRTTIETTIKYISEPSINMKPPLPPPAILTPPKKLSDEVMGLSPPPPPTSMSPPPIHQSSSLPSSHSKGESRNPLVSTIITDYHHSVIPLSNSYNTINYSYDPNTNNQLTSSTIPVTTTTTVNDKIIQKYGNKKNSQNSLLYNVTSPKLIYNEYEQNSSIIEYISTTTPVSTSIKISRKPSNFNERTTPITIDTTTRKFYKNRIQVNDIINQQSPTNNSYIEKDDDKISELLNVKISPTPSIKDHIPPETHIITTKGNKLDRIKNKNILTNTNNKQQNHVTLITSSEYSSIDDENRMTTTQLQNKETKGNNQQFTISTKTRLVNKVVLPTKYVTNTKTLTVTTTKTTVIKSQGIPSTQTLTLTKTQISTIVDTVTETQTHTLLQPTSVKVLLPQQTHATVTTVYTLPEYQNYPVFPDDYVVKHTSDEHLLFDDEVTDTKLDELIINSDEDTTKFKINNQTRNVQINKKKPAIVENDSIFVLMTDNKTPPGLININSSMMETPQNINAIGDSDYDNFNLPNRDEESESEEANHILLGGILIASPPKVQDSSKHTISTTGFECRPDCKASRNELCQRIEGVMRCVCRPGFARMFPDRPCKPTYTYSLSLPLYRINKELLTYDDRLSDNNSDQFYHLAEITHEALDRMVMQSDFRDVYHGIHVTGFEKSNNDNGIIGNFYLQLSDNSDENRLVDVFKKYLRSNNYSIGGTDLFTAKSGVDQLSAIDFNECLDNRFHDCSENSHCFNLHGTYTCSCKEGYADLSGNPVYPGRKCSAELIGCEKCYYHGTCYTPDDMDQPLCECFQWYAGASCQLNLKILLIALLAIGTILFILLLFCILVTCSKRHKAKSMQTIMAGINILPPKNSRSIGTIKLDKRAMIKDSSSEASHNSDTLPYVSKKESKKMNIGEPSYSQHGNLQREVKSATPQTTAERRCSLLDQNDRSLTVMIPRAKYYPIPHQSPTNMNLDFGRQSCTTETKILSYLDTGTLITPSKKISSDSSKLCSRVHSPPSGALVSAGFEVSATVGQDSISTSECHIGQKGVRAIDQQPSRRAPDLQSTHSEYNKKAESSGEFMDNMDNWLNCVQQNDLTASEPRSYDETTIQPPTKTLRNAYEKQLTQMNNDEANTMAERDVGSTFLLPHTHLYKPDRGSDVSGFDSF